VKKASLAAELSRLEGFEDPRISLEQYTTPPELAADMLWTAHMAGDLDGEVVDLGAGTGILGIGAAMLGASVTLVEMDAGALEKARKNARDAGVEVETVEGDVENLEMEFETALMNPPFSVHSEQLEGFLEAASRASTVYSVANADGSGVAEGLERRGFSVEEVEQYTIGLPATFGFHTQEERETSVSVVVGNRGSDRF
jgi:putative methylase